MNRSLTFRSVTLNVDGLFVGGSGINLPGLILVLIGAAVATTDHRWWLPLVVLAIVPIVVFYGWACRRAGFEPVVERFRPVGTANELERLRAELKWAQDGAGKYDALTLDLHTMINAAGGVPADIRLRQRVECLILQRDGEIPKECRADVWEQ